MPRKIDPEMEKAVVRSYAEGLRGPEIARRVGCDPTTVYSVLKRNGVGRTRPGYSPAERKEILAIWKRTASIKAIQKSFPGIGKNTVRSIADAAGEVERGRGGFAKTSTAIEERVCAEYKEGAVARKIGAKYDVSKSTVLSILKRAGIERRDSTSLSPVKKALSETHPALAQEWHPDKNESLAPSSVAANATRRVWWQCPEGPDHEWNGTVRLRALGGCGCPFCAGKRVSVTNSLAQNRSLAAQWHPSLNKKLRPGNVVATSTAMVWWKCPVGPDHEWQARLVDRVTGGNGCPSCRGLRPSQTNSIATKFPRLVPEWHSTKNGSLTPDQIVAGQNKKVWWKCPKGPDHEWAASPNSRTHAGRGCPFCANLRLSVTNSLSRRFPALAAQWHPEKNGTLTPDGVTAYSTIVVWWKCPKAPDHEWSLRVNDRSVTEGGCPFCSGHRVCPSNSLASRPDLVAEWHPVKNPGMSPDRLVATSARMVWWRCKRNPSHEWKAIPNHRVRQNTGCPDCTIAPRSREEIRLAFEIHALIDFDLEAHKVTAGGQRWDVDILVEDLKVIVEYDGAYWHKDKEEADRAKTKALEAAGWRVIRVRQEPLRVFRSNDRALPRRTNTKHCANLVLAAIEERSGVAIPGLRTYLQKKFVVNGPAAEKCLDELFSSASQATNDTLVPSIPSIY